MTDLPDRASSTARNRINLLGVLIDNITLEATAFLLESWLAERRNLPDTTPRLIVTANPEYVMAARRDPAFLQLVNSAGLVTADGIGLIIAGRLLGTPFQQRITGVALAEMIFKLSAQKGWRLFLLGAAPGVAEDAAQNIRLHYPGVCIVGTWAGEFSLAGDAEAVARIRQSGAEIVLVAYGMVKQDWWSARNLKHSGASMAIGVGGVLDYKAGRVPLAPLRLRRWGLEWAYRLYKEPWRWRRQLALPRFVAAVLLTRLRRATLRNSKE